VSFLSKLLIFQSDSSAATIVLNLLCRIGRAREASRRVAAIYQRDAAQHRNPEGQYGQMGKGVANVKGQSES
jgi:hypothetical protein